MSEFPIAAVATKNGYEFIGGEPSFSDRQEQQSFSFIVPRSRVCGHGVPAEEWKKDLRRYDSHGKHGRKKVKSRHLSR